MGVPPWRAGTPLQYPYDQAFINNNSSPLNIPIISNDQPFINKLTMLNTYNDQPHLSTHIVINPFCQISLQDGAPEI